MAADGVPAVLHEPLDFLITSHLSVEDQRVADRVEALRAEVAARIDPPATVYRSPSALTVDPQGRVEPGAPIAASWARLAQVTSVSPYWGAFLYLCAKASRARTILELGGCVGISGCYLASSPSCERFVSVEGSPDAARAADTNLRRIGPHASVVHAWFDDALDRLLPELGGLDLVHLDGQHEGAATRHYVERLQPHLRAGAIVICDDIHWSAGMEDAWRDLAVARGTAAAVDVGRCGVLVWSGANVPPRMFDFSAYAAYWRKGQPEAETSRRA